MRFRLPQGDHGHGFLLKITAVPSQTVFISDPKFCALKSLRILPDGTPVPPKGCIDQVMVTLTATRSAAP